jgi:hypothetical protein
MGSKPDKRDEFRVVLKDNGVGGKTIGVAVTHTDGYLEITPDGYGDCSSNDGEGCPVLLELYEGEICVRLYGDINSEEPTHNIRIEGARESLREPDEPEESDEVRAFVFESPSSSEEPRRPGEPEWPEADITGQFVQPVSPLEEHVFPIGSYCPSDDEVDEMTPAELACGWIYTWRVEEVGLYDGDFRTAKEVALYVETLVTVDTVSKEFDVKVGAADLRLAAYIESGVVAVSASSAVVKSFGLPLEGEFIRVAGAHNGGIIVAIGKNPFLHGGTRQYFRATKEDHRPIGAMGEPFDAEQAVKDLAELDAE